MKINHNPINHISAHETENTVPIERNNVHAMDGGVDSLNGKDKATLSERARILSKARVALDEVPEVRSDKVDALRKDVQTGNYKIPVEQIVKQLVNHVRMK
jgi:flagellar biosynthesis anti-sigma factor FlgM